ncbi:MAG: YbaK/EbsC family protein [Verrucomicrobiales bacterium]|nr:YbaK/EbsC family protein [Verrucomicrobiales bacterium]
MNLLAVGRRAPCGATRRKELSMPAKLLKEFLDREHVSYVSIQHSPAYTAQEIAASAHVPGRDMAKTVILKIDGRLAMAALPANRKIVLADLREATGAQDVKFATEDEFKALFPDCETGAMPPFGNLYGLEVFVAPSLTQEREIAFNAGTHTEVIKMAYQDFERLVHPKVMMFTT